jgi:hypothetical protein
MMNSTFGAIIYAMIIDPEMEYRVFSKLINHNVGAKVSLVVSREHQPLGSTC